MTCLRYYTIAARKEKGWCFFSCWAVGDIRYVCFGMVFYCLNVSNRNSHTV